MGGLTIPCTEDIFLNITSALYIYIYIGYDMQPKYISDDCFGFMVLVPLNLGLRKVATHVERLFIMQLDFQIKLQVYHSQRTTIKENCLKQYYTPCLLIGCPHLHPFFFYTKIYISQPK